MFVAAVKKALSLTLPAHFKTEFLPSTLYLGFCEGVSAINMERHFQFHTEPMALPCNLLLLRLDDRAGTESRAGREAATCGQCQRVDGPVGLQKTAVSLTDGWYHEQKAQLLLAQLHAACSWLILMGTASWKNFPSYRFSSRTGLLHF